MHARMIFVLGFMLVLTIVPLASAQVYFCEKTSQDWFTLSNWCDSDCSSNCGQDPDGDDAIIKGNKTCNMNGTDDVETISVEVGGILNIQSSGILSVTEDDDDCGGFGAHCATSDIDGDLNLTGQIKFDLGMDENDQQHMVSGTGAIKGTASSAIIRMTGNDLLSDPHQLVLTGTISGIVDIDDLNDGDEGIEYTVLMIKGGIVHANAEGLLKVRFDKIDDEAGTQAGLLKVSTYSSARLELDYQCNTGSELLCPSFCLEYTNGEIFEGTMKVVDENLTMLGTMTGQPGGIFDPDSNLHYFSADSCGSPEG